jgi:hypothetical protein
VQELAARDFLMTQDYYSALARVVMASARNDPQLRNMIYGLARHKLRRQVDWEIRERLDTCGSKKLLALETAIGQIEADLARDKPPKYANWENQDQSPRVQGAIEIIPPSQLKPPPYQIEGELTPDHSVRRSFGLRVVIPSLGVMILGVLAYLAFQREFQNSSYPGAESHSNVSSSDKRRDLPGVPIPSSYGVYAIANGQLAELEPLPIRVPDGRTAGSAAIATKSTTTLANGRIKFIVFKRDLVSNVPEKVAVRALTCVSCVDSAEATSTNAVGEAWAIRGISYDMRVAPVGGNPAMIVIRGADPDFSFPAGRYALVLKGVAYDFSIEPDLKKH